VPFGPGNGIVDDAGAGLDVQHAVLDDGGADGDGGIHVAVPGQVADRTRVDAALDRLQFVDDLHGADLRRAADRAGREGRPQHVLRAHAVFEHAVVVGDVVHHVRIAFDDHLLGELHRTGLGDAADVVTAEIDQHQVLGELLGIGEQLAL